MDGIAEMEPLFTAQEVADYLHLDVSTVRRIFLDQPGVVKISSMFAKKGKRSYVTVRIPRSVLERFTRERGRR